MNTYHKIQTIFKRDPLTKFRTLLYGEYSLPEFEFLKDNVWVWDEKIDGTNIRIKFVDGKLSFAGKTDKSEFYGNFESVLKDKFLPLQNTFSDIFGTTDVCMYGEGYGKGIQKGGNYRPDTSFILFDIKIGEWWLKREDVAGISLKLDTEIVPIIGEGTLEQAIEITRNGFNSQWGNFMAEGMVLRPKVELKSRNGSRIITKIKTKDFN